MIAASLRSEETANAGRDVSDMDKPCAVWKALRCS